MIFRTALAIALMAGLSIPLLQGGSVGCGGGVPLVASTLEGSYDCSDGCIGTCTFDDVLEMTLGERHAADDYTGLRVAITITTANNVFDEELTGVIRDDGRFGFILADSSGMSNMDCGGPPLADGAIVIDCKATAEVDGAVIETTCQQATYVKREEPL